MSLAARQKGMGQGVPGCRSYHTLALQGIAHQTEARRRRDCWQTPCVLSELVQQNTAASAANEHLPQGRGPLQASDNSNHNTPIGGSAEPACSHKHPNKVVLQVHV